MALEEARGARRLRAKARTESFIFEQVMIVCRRR